MDSGDKISEAEIPEATKTGYDFDGWYLSTDDSKTVIDFSTYSVAGDAKFYPKYTEHTYTITFKSDRGTAPDAVSKKYSDYVSLYHKSTYSYYGDYQIEITGYTFEGWQDENGKQVTNLSSHEGDITLTAIWTPWTTTVCFNSSSASGSMTSQTFNYGETKALKANEFYKKGYKFIGCGTSYNEKTVTYTDEQSVTLNSTSSKGTTLNLFALWEKLPLTLSVKVSSISSASDISVEYVSKSSCLKATYSGAESFSWFVDGMEIPGEKSDVLSVYRISEGTHTVMVATTESGGNILSATLVVSVTTSE